MATDCSLKFEGVVLQKKLSSPFDYASEFLANDFKYNQGLNFRIDNDWDSIEAITLIFVLVFEIIDSMQSNLLFLLND
ncbi:hypothetical protein MHB84_08295 [Paenibacillus sp. FSL F4-0087]|uniref:hypothetical protein n=1 Tax=Paenibacillus sp. FSL F4-0087 TaxID=2921368 RepID=UPI00096E48C4|nr:hypothetical protein BK122_18960 [Paenibacillus pabuli]